MIAALLLFSLWVLSARAEGWDCHQVSVSGANFDLSPLAGEHRVSRSRQTPPSNFMDEFTFDLCGEIKHQEDAAGHDQCPPGTYACLISTNEKGNELRITHVVPLATETELSPKYSALSKSQGLILTFNGPSYPPSSDPPVPQSISFQLLCSQSDEAPILKGYSAGRLNVEWSSNAACPLGKAPPKSPGDGSQAGNGLGLFFILFLISIGAYLGLGAYYNYSNYGAQGWDLIPHRDFWREVPYLIGDVVSHLFSSFRPSGRGGYVQV